MYPPRPAVRLSSTVASCVALCCLALCCLARWGYDQWQRGRRETNVDRLEEAVYDVDGVLSPFELLISRPSSGAQRPAANRQRARVRLLGIGPPWPWQPETEPWLRGATAAAAEFVRGGQVRVRLARRQVAEDGVLLAYLYVGDQMLNEFLVRQGWVTARTHPDETSPVTRQLQAAEKAARQSARGIWSGPAPDRSEGRPSVQ